MWEEQSFERTVAEATVDLSDRDKLDAVLRIIVEYQQSYPGLRMVDIEPAHVIKRLAQILPLMRDRLERLLPGDDVAAAAVRARRDIHYLVLSDDADAFSRSCGTPPESPTRSRLLEFGEDLVGVLAELRCPLRGAHGVP